MGPIGMQEMMLIFILALLLFGPKKLPELGRMLAKGLTEFRRAKNELKSTFESHLHELERETRIETSSSSTPSYSSPPLPLYFRRVWQNRTRLFVSYALPGDQRAGCEFVAVINRQRNRSTGRRGQPGILFTEFARGWNCASLQRLSFRRASFCPGKRGASLLIEAE